MGSTLCLLVPPIHKTPVIGVCIDSPVGWPGKYTLPLSEIGGWPTHSRYRESGAGQEVLDEIQLKDAINYYLRNPMANQLERQKFIERECTHTDGSAGRHTADFILTQLKIVSKTAYLWQCGFS